MNLLPMPPPRNTDRSAPDDDMADALADGFAAQVRRWTLACGAAGALADTMAVVARALSLASAGGHACLNPQALAGLPVDPGPDGWRAALLASGVVAALEPGLPGSRLLADQTPMVVDADARLYLRRYADYEQRLAAQVVRRLAGASSVGAANAPATVAATGAATAAAVHDDLPALFAALFPAPGQPGTSSLTDAQQAAARAALAGQLTLICGGPGTGKTSSVVAMLAGLLTRSPGLRVVLAAPTGKAAARMLEAIHSRAAQLPDALRARLPAQAYTLHRLLGATGDTGRFVHHRGHRLALDLLVVDESSMLDLALATRLVEALPDNARLVLLGDRDQLSAVEAGSVFGDLAGAPAPLASQVVTLTHSHRFAGDSGIGRLAADIQAGRGQASLDWTRNGQDSAVAWLDESGDGLSGDTWSVISDGYRDYFDRVADLHTTGDGQGTGAAGLQRQLAALFQAFESFRVLCAVRGGPRGVDRINELLERPLRRAAGLLPAGGDGAVWFHGRPVLVTRNDPALRLFNGDIGLCLADGAGDLSVWFAQSDGYRRIGIARMPAHQSALAMTVHKSQGSEFDRVLLLLAGPASPLNTRELLYTAVTRARRRVWLAGQAEAWLAGCANRVSRDGGLPARLLEAQAALAAQAAPLAAGAGPLTAPGMP